MNRANFYTSVCLALLLLFGMTAPRAEAESQAGGLPDVSARVGVLEGIATTLQTQVTTLQTQVTTLQSDNTALRNLLNAETETRTIADNVERAARVATDATLTGLISTLQDRLNKVAEGTYYEEFRPYLAGALDHGAFAIVATLADIPPGNYLVIGTANVFNEDHNVVWYCRTETPGAVIDVAITSTINSSLSSGGSDESLAMVGTVTLTAPASTLQLGCQNLQANTDSYIRTARLVAVKIGASGR